MATISQIQVNNSTYDIVDTKAKQLASTSSTARPILLGYDTAPNSDGYAYYAAGITVTPSTGDMNLGNGTVTASAFSGKASSAGEADHAITANRADTATAATTANEAAHATVADQFASAADITLAGSVIGTHSSTHDWTINTSIANSAIGSTHIQDNAITISKLADEIGIVVVQSSEPSSNGAAKIWVKI